jgi:RNA polymerase sigma-70 factor (ECF subfamily)
MNQETPLGELLARVRVGDAAAAAEVVRRYETAVRVAVRTRLTDPALRRQFDSMDICQSVFLSFYLRAAAGQFDLERPEDLVGLLVRMAQNKLASQARYHHREKRDVRRVVADGGERLDALSEGAAPDQVAVGRELLTRVRAELTAEEQAIADHRAAGRTWDEVARELGGTAEARRKQYERAIDRVVAKLGIDEDEPDE